ncbi:Nudix family hydrolase [Dokdonella sp.]|uniref:Nudix family hydrolase n=1 Tax=Dokdonella sp. TaxID=2291710 RepID=UPI002F41CAF4
MPASIHVVAGVLRDAGGRVLLARRPAGKHLAGLWEFPGGKCDAGEAPVDALARELREEIGVVVESARPLIAVPHRYPEQDILLDVWRVSAWSGVPHPHEGQALAWVERSALPQVAMPPADRPVIAALELPDRYLITPETSPDELGELTAGIERACRRGLRLIQLRQPHWPRARLAEAARSARAICHEHGTRLLLNGDVQLAMVLGLDGVHMPARLAADLVQRPLPPDRWFGVSCHDAAELLHAVRVGADFATLSPVLPTPGHEQAEALGWERFADLVAHAPMPVYALGGMEGEDIDAAWMAGAQGIAAIRGLWA